MVVLVLGAETALVEQALAELSEDDGAIVLDPSAAALETVERAVRDPRLWFLIGDAAVVPLPDRSVDAAVGGESADVARVLR